MNGIKDKVAIVTGGARGIGRAIAQRLTAEGAKVVIADILKDEGIKTANELKLTGGEVSFIHVDMEKIQQVNEMVQFAVSKYGTLDILINNVGIQIREEAVRFTEKDWDKIFNINLKSAFFASQCAAKIMIPKGKGSIVCISSGNSVNFTSKRSPYCISKAAVNAMTAALGNEWARYGLRVNAVAPGWLLTDMVKDGMRMGLIDEKLLMSVLPNKRFAETSEVADAVCFLASDQASCVVGQTLFVDGGWSVNGLPENKEI